MAEELSSVVAKWLSAREATYGTDVIDLANNLATARRYEYFRAESTIDPVVERRDRAGTRPSFGSTRGINVRRNLAVEITGDVVAANNPGNAGGEYPFGMADCMVYSGMAETIVSATSATYAPSTAATAGGTFYHWRRFLDAAQTWQFIYATGVRGNFTLSAEAGEIATWSFSGRSNNFPLNSGVTANPHGWSVDLAWFDTDGTILLDKNGASIVYTGTETVDDPTPMYFEGGTFTIDGTTFTADSIKIDHRNQVTEKLAGTANPFVDAVYITQRGVAVEIGVANTGADFEKALDKCLDNAEVSGTFVFTDRTGTGGSTLTITCNKLQFDFPTARDVDGLRAWTIPLAANPNWGGAQIGDNEISYAWTVT